MFSASHCLTQVSAEGFLRGETRDGGAELFGVGHLGPALRRRVPRPVQAARPAPVPAHRRQVHFPGPADPAIGLVPVVFNFSWTFDVSENTTPKMEMTSNELRSLDPYRWQRCERCNYQLKKSLLSDRPIC